MSIISKGSLMYWLHKTYTTSEYTALSNWEYEDIYDEDGNLVDYRIVPDPKPVDGCSWYRKGFLLLILTFLLSLGGLWGAIFIGYSVVNFLAFLLGGFVVFSWVDLDWVIPVLVVGGVGVLILFISTLIDTVDGTKPLFPEYMSKHFPKKKDKPAEVKEVKQHSAIAHYYKAIKEKYCPVLTLEKDE